MSCLAWNCRGLGTPRAIRALKDLVRSNKPKLVFLMETKMQISKLLNLRISLGFKHAFGVDRVGLGGGLVMMWHEEWEVSL